MILSSPSKLQRGHSRLLQSLVMTRDLHMLKVALEEWMIPLSFFKTEVELLPVMERE